MKIALCFSGQLRNVKSTFDNWYKPNVLEPNKHHEIDVFVHTWYNNETVGTVYYAANEVPNSVVASDSIPENIIQHVYDAYNPVRMELQRPIIFDEKNYNERRLHGAVPQNGLSRLYSLYRSVLLKVQHEQENNFKYDAVVVTRFDFTLKRPFLFDIVNKKGIYHPGFSPHGFNVCYAMGDSESIDTYATLYHHVDEVFNTGIHWCDENLAKRFSQMCNLPVYDFNVENGLNRGTIS